MSIVDFNFCIVHMYYVVNDTVTNQWFKKGENGNENKKRETKESVIFPIFLKNK